MCFLHAKSSEISKNADIFCIFCKLKCDTIKLIAKEYFFLFLCDPYDFTLLRIEGHKPFTLPGFEKVKV